MVHSSITTLALVIAKPAPKPANGQTTKATEPGRVRSATSAMPTPADGHQHRPSLTNVRRVRHRSRPWIWDVAAQLIAESISGMPASVGE